MENDQNHHSPNNQYGFCTVDALKLNQLEINSSNDKCGSNLIHLLSPKHVQNRFKTNDYETKYTLKEKPPGGHSYSNTCMQNFPLESAYRHQKYYESSLGTSSFNIRNDLQQFNNDLHTCCSLPTVPSVSISYSSADPLPTGNFSTQSYHPGICVQQNVALRTPLTYENGCRLRPGGGVNSAIVRSQIPTSRELASSYSSLDQNIIDYNSLENSEKYLSTFIPASIKYSEPVMSNSASCINSTKIINSSNADNSSEGKMHPTTPQSLSYYERFVSSGKNLGNKFSPYEFHPEEDQSKRVPLPLTYGERGLANYLNSDDDGFSDGLINSDFISKETVEVLGPEEVRWCYKAESDKKWVAFIGYDSIKIEWAYRQFLHKSVSNPTEDSSSYEMVTSSGNYTYKSESLYNGTERPVVCGGLYEVDVPHLKGYSIYWKGGTWFYEGSWTPVEAGIAGQIEAEHIAKFQGSTITTSVCDKDSQQAGYKLHRGYCIDASSDDKPPDITKIVFVIHGIGQKMETGRIIKNCTSIRENIKWLKEKQFPWCDFTNQNVEFFPVEWRSSLTLDAGIIESITPHKIIGLRQMLNASFMDIMYYNSPQYREEIVNGLASELNRLYTMFTDRNPYFEANGGKVSVLAHSLGCVITYDIVTGWCPAPQMSPSFLQALINLTERRGEADSELALKSFQSALHVVLQQQLEKSSQPRLKFKIENFFCLGSPLAVFLGLRQKKQGHAASLPLFSQSSFERLFNIFHPADPVAYRIEPLICPKFASIAPVPLHSYSTSDKLPYEEMPLEPLNVASRPSSSKSDTPPDQLEAELLTATPSSSATTPIKGATTPSKGSGSWNLLNFMKQPKKEVDPALTLSAGELNVLEALHQRVDYVLREGSMESSYLSALTSHTSYWSNLDVAYFLLCTFCPQVLQQEYCNVHKLS